MSLYISMSQALADDFSFNPFFEDENKSWYFAAFKISDKDVRKA